jgi:hypothetical protein
MNGIETELVLTSFALLAIAAAGFWGALSRVVGPLWLRVLLGLLGLAALILLIRPFV